MLTLLTATGASGMSSMLVTLVLMLAVFYFMLIRPENKRKKEAEQMRSSVKNGDKITTIGGIVGTVVNVKENNLVVETGADQVRIEIAKWGIQSTESMEAAAAQKGKKSVPAKKDEKKEEEPAAKAEEPKTVEAAEVPAAKEEQKEEKPSYDPEIK